MLPDLRYAFRQLLKSPGFTCVAVLALALGIGANTAVFSVVHGVLLRPLAFPEQERLVFIGEWSEQVPNMSVSYPNFLDWRDRQKSFTAIGVARFQGFNYVGPHETERLEGAMVSHDLLQALAVAPIRGRAFSADDDRIGAERTVILSAPLWRRLFGGRDSILGEQIQLSGHLYRVVGVMPDAFQYPTSRHELWVPLGVFGEQYQDRGSHPGLYAAARLKPGITFDAAVADMKAIAAQLAAEHPETNARLSVSMQSLTDRAFGNVRPALFVLLGAAGFVLLIACANVANLQLARAHARAREFAVRAALGAGRGRVIRQLLVESILLGALGCGAGIALAVWSLDLLRSFLPAGIPRIEQVELNAPVLLFAVAASLLTSVIFGLVPALHASRQDLRETLAQGARAGGAASGNRWRSTLIVAEVALTCVLLVGAGLMVRTLANLYRADPGYSVERTLTFNWFMPRASHPTPESRAPLLDRALERLGALPGVTHTGLITPLPLSGNSTQNTYYVEGTPIPEPGRQPTTEVFQASGSMFSTLRIPVLTGRVFEPQDTPTSPRVAVVDTRFAEKNFPGQDPIGKRFTFGSRPPEKESDWVQIVGVAAHIQNYSFGQDTREQVYTAYTQDIPSFVVITLRTTQDPAAITTSIRALMREITPDLPIFGVRTMDDYFEQSIGTQRLTVLLLGAFAGLALLLATLGLYGVLTYNVGQRTREIGVRMALGATEGSVVSLVLRHGLKLAVVGLSIGLLASLGLTRLLRTVLFEVSAFDPLSFAAVAFVLAGVATLACWLPARRAARVDPINALRAE